MPDMDAEWLESDGLGGFASGTVGGERTRRYHAILLSARNPPTGRLVLVNGFDAYAQTKSGAFALSTQRYLPDVESPDGVHRLESFEPDPWPTWRYRTQDGVGIQQELFAVHGLGLTVLRWRLTAPLRGVSLTVRPFLSGRDYHATHHENPSFRFDARVEGEWVRMAPYPGIPEIYLLSNGAYLHDPQWYHRFLYTKERDRGLDFTEDLAAPGVFHFDLAAGPGVLILASSLSDGETLASPAALCSERLAERERTRRAAFRSPLHRSADAYLVARGTGSTIVAGYPWFTDWGRDTFISLRGLCSAGGRFTEAADIVVEWAGAVDQGMLPNFFPDAEREPEYNSVDASLWYIIAAHDLMARMKVAGTPLAAKKAELVWDGVDQILRGYSRGTRYGIGVDPADGLLSAGEPGVQITWMDAKVGDWVVTPRIGKPVEIQALWLNALSVAAERWDRWKAPLAQGMASFAERFWNEERGCLFDVVDVDHTAGRVDSSMRPNQIFAVGGLPLVLVSAKRARSIVDTCEGSLLTPTGLRSLAPGEPGYASHYHGSPRERDGAYHQGTVWPWLLGAFVEAWVRVRGDTAKAKADAYSRFVTPLEEAMSVSGGIGHLAEITDAQEPFTLRGCPFQAWSLGELLRLKLDVLKIPGGGSDRKG